VRTLCIESNEEENFVLHILMDYNLARIYEKFYSHINYDLILPMWSFGKNMECLFSDLDHDEINNKKCQVLNIDEINVINIYNLEKQEEFKETIVKESNQNNISAYQVNINEPLIKPDHVHNFEGVNILHSECHNIYGALINKSIYESLKLSRPNERPVIISNSNCIMYQKYVVNMLSIIHNVTNDIINKIIINGLLGNGILGVEYICGDNVDKKILEILMWIPIVKIKINDSHNMRLGSKLELLWDQRFQNQRYLYTHANLVRIIGEPMIKPLFWDSLLQLENNDLGIENSFIVGDVLIFFANNLNDLDNIEESLLGLYKKINVFHLTNSQMYLKMGKIYYQNSHLDTADQILHDYKLRLFVYPHDEVADCYFYYDFGMINHNTMLGLGLGSMKQYWFGKIIYVDGKIKFNRIDGDLSLPMFSIDMVVF
jgi:hypothetical protein